MTHTTNDDDERPYTALMADLQVGVNGHGLSEDRRRMLEAFKAIRTLQDQLAIPGPEPDVLTTVAAGVDPEEFKRYVMDVRLILGAQENENILDVAKRLIEANVTLQNTVNDQAARLNGRIEGDLPQEDAYPGFVGKDGDGELPSATGTGPATPKTMGDLIGGDADEHIPDTLQE